MDLSLCSQYDPISLAPVHTQDIRVLTCFDVEANSFCFDDATALDTVARRHGGVGWRKRPCICPAEGALRYKTS
jgi:hypothetical protein